ncbi:guanylate kinase [Desulfamplus magnetovallimortis]|uniref:Guanylate kinase n=1 Tax=Desulfamplus magnetovallimortis TaxID=1246637 RepID=A0A1W1HC93_9BACT|nr:guanylate kinase [Desulfamplus magnetovallimortis]SLM30121.1 guanylate kinase [Desulfamplus magnetovallimortis]
MNSLHQERKRGDIFVVSAPSGAGKSTLCMKVLETFPDISFSVSHTTRPPRLGEQHGVDYYFISVDEFRERIKNNLWAEWAEVHGNYYGTSCEEIEDNLNHGRHLLLDIDVQGAEQIMRAFPEAVTIFVMPPSIEILEQRLRKRGTDSDDTIAKRLENAAGEIARKDLYQHVIVNDNLEQAQKDFLEIFSITLK